MKRLALPFVLLSLAGPAMAAQTITPGYWESTNKVISPIRQSSTERRCITPADVEKFLSGPSNRHYACTYPTRVFAGGKIRLKGACVSKKGQKIAIEGAGTYTPTSFNLTAEVAMVFLGLDVAGKATTEARRLGDTCPAPEAAARPPPEAAARPPPAPTAAPSSDKPADAPAAK